MPDSLSHTNILGTARALDKLLLGLLAEESGAQPWWLGYLDVGGNDVILPDMLMVTLYAGWKYVLVEAGRSQAADRRTDDAWKGKLPDLVFSGRPLMAALNHGCSQHCGMTTGGALADPDTWCNASSTSPDLMPAKSAAESTRYHRGTFHGDPLNLKDWR